MIGRKWCFGIVYPNLVAKVVAKRGFSENAHKTKTSTASPKELIAFMKQSRAANIANINGKLYEQK